MRLNRLKVKKMFKPCDIEVDKVRMFDHALSEEEILFIVKDEEDKDRNEMENENE